MLVKAVRVLSRLLRARLRKNYKAAFDAGEGVADRLGLGFRRYGYDGGFVPVIQFDYCPLILIARGPVLHFRPVHRLGAIHGRDLRDAWRRQGKIGDRFSISLPDFRENGLQDRYVRLVVVARSDIVRRAIVSERRSSSGVVSCMRVKGRSFDI